MGRYADENGNNGSRPHTPAPLEADCHEIFETGQILLSSLGYPLFEPLRGVISQVTRDETFRCTANGADGRGIYTAEGFVVLQGSIGRHGNVASILGTSIERFRQKLIETGVQRVEGESVIFTRDHLFRSPSGAALALLGRSANGWIEWTNAQGQTLDQVKRNTAT